MESATLSLKVSNVEDAPYWVASPVPYVAPGVYSYEIEYAAVSPDQRPLTFKLNPPEKPADCQASKKDDLPNGRVTLKFSCTSGLVRYTLEVSDNGSLPTPTLSGSLEFSVRPYSVGSRWKTIGNGIYVSNAWGSHQVSSCLNYTIPSGKTKMIVNFSTSSEGSWDFLTARLGSYSSETRTSETLRTATHSLSGNNSNRTWEIELSELDLKASVCFIKDYMNNGSSNPEYSVHSVTFK